MAKAPARIHYPRNSGEFAAIVESFLKKTKMSATKLSALAVGDIRFVGNVVSGNAKRVSIDACDAVLTFIEANPKGIA